MRSFWITSVLSISICVGVATAGTGIATTTFIIPNQTGVTVNDLHVTLDQSPDTLTSQTFPIESQNGTVFDFSG